MKRNIWLLSTILLLCLAVLPAKAEAIGGGLIIDNFQVDDNGVITGYVGGRDNMPERLVIPSDPRITAIGDNAFDGYWAGTGNTVTKEVVIPANIESIGSLAFYRCDALTKVTFESGSRLKKIGVRAFANCISLTSIELPDTVEELGASCFSYCDSLTRAKLSKNLKGEPVQTLAGTLWRTLPDDLFYRCEKLTYVDLNGAKVEGIGQHAFYRCMELTTITGLTTSPGVLVVPEGVTLLGQHAFGECKGLTSASLPSTLMRIYMGSNIFSGCENLRTAVINETAGTSLPSGIFYNCKKLDSVTLPGNLTSIGSGAFRDCDVLKEVRFGGRGPVVRRHRLRGK